MPSSVSCFPSLLLPQMLPGDDGITSIVPRQHLPGWSAPDKCWTSEGLIPGECSQQHQGSAGLIHFLTLRILFGSGSQLFLKSAALRYHRWSFSSRRCILGHHLWFCRSDKERTRKAAARMTVFPTAPQKSQELMLQRPQPLLRWLLFWIHI